MVIYFVLWIMIQYFILLLELFHLQPLEALSVGSCTPVQTYPNYFLTYPNYFLTL